ncbi:unnamed protein product [Aphanomyces euteiches]|nr:hypothetical protein AeRB84_019959 [Aphanomyces euteiches]
MSPKTKTKPLKMTKAQLVEPFQLLQRHVSLITAISQGSQVDTPDTHDVTSTTDRNGRFRHTRYGEIDRRVGTVVGLPVAYTQDMVSTLLELRYTSFKAAFNGNLSSKQLSILWAKLALRFNIMTDQPLKVNISSNIHRV